MTRDRAGGSLRWPGVRRRLRRYRAARAGLLGVTVRLDTGNFSLSRLDLLGAVTVAAVGVWTLVAAAGRPSSPENFLLGLLTVAAAYAVGRIAGERSAYGACAAVAGAVAVVFLMSPDALSGHALAEPLGYGNANGALATQAVGAACLAALAAPNERRRGEMHLLAGLLVLGAFATKSVAAALGGVAILVIGLTATAARRRGTLVVAGAVCVAAMALGTVYLGGDKVQHMSGVRLTAEEGLTQRRLDVWHDALTLAAANPVRGTGPGTFVANSPTARADSDTQAAHSLWLRQAAEQGYPGLAAMVALVGWAFVRLWRSRQDPAIVAVGAVTLTAFAVQASMDYVAEFGGVLIALGVVLGVGTAVPDPVLEKGIR